MVSWRLMQMFTKKCHSVHLSCVNSAAYLKNRNETDCIIAGGSVTHTFHRPHFHSEERWAQPAEFLRCQMRKCKTTSTAKHKNKHEIWGRKIKREEPSVEQIKRGGKAKMSQEAKRRGVSVVGMVGWGASALMLSPSNLPPCKHTLTRDESLQIQTLLIGLISCTVTDSLCLSQLCVCATV